MSLISDISKFLKDNSIEFTINKLGKKVNNIEFKVRMPNGAVHVYRNHNKLLTMVSNYYNIPIPKWIHNYIPIRTLSKKRCTEMARKIGGYIGVIRYPYLGHYNWIPVWGVESSYKNANLADPQHNEISALRHALALLAINKGKIDYCFNNLYIVCDDNN